jgi:BASS family bile acid:Na+ symporter
MEEAPLYVKFLMYLFVVVYMLSVMLETTHGEIVTMLKDRHRMGLALLANLVVVPILSLVLVRLLDLRPEIRIGVMMLAISPGGLFALQFAFPRQSRLRPHL